MYKNNNIRLIVVMLFCALIYFNNAMAKDCYEKSPNFVALKDKYYDLDTTKELTRADKTKLNKLFDKIEGKWEGDLTVTECTGPDRAPRKKIINGSIVVKIKPGTNDNFLIAAKKSYPDNTIKYDGIEILGDMKIFDFDFLNDNELVFTERNVMKNNNGIPRYVENIYEIRFNRRSLVLIREYYSHGVFVSEEKWSLQQ